MPESRRITQHPQVEVESEQTEPLDRVQAAFVNCPQLQQSMGPLL